MVEGRCALRTAAVILLSLACGACQKFLPTTTAPEGTPPPLQIGPKPAAILLTAPAVSGALTLGTNNGLSLPLGTTKQLTATEMFSNGTTRSVTSLVQWSSSSTTTGTVSATGLVTADRVGNATISASIDGLTQGFPLSVGPALASLSIATDVSALWVGDVQPLQLVATFTDGSTMDVTDQATWSSSATSIATVSAAGVATGVAAGMTTFTASLDRQTATAQATVLPTQPQVVSIAIGTDNAPLPSTTLSVLPTLSQALGVWGTLSETGAVVNVTANTTWSWQSSDTTKATVSPGGVVQGVASGTATITVSGLGKTATLDVTVTAAVQSIAIGGLPASLGPRTYMFPDVIATLADGTAVDASGWATLTSSSRHIAALEGQAIVGRNAGTATITATLGSITTTAAVNVKAISSLAVVPASLTIPVGQTDNWVAAFATLSDGALSEATETVTWASNDPTTADFGTPGAIPNTPLSGLQTGSTTISATLEGTSGMGQVQVTPPLNVSSLALSPSTATLNFDGAQQLTALATLSNSMTLDVTRLVSWTPMGTGGLTFTSDFLAGDWAGLSPAGTETIAAQIGTATASATFTIASAAITAVSISPQNIMLSAGGTQALTVMATYAGGATADVTSQAVWTSTDSLGTITVVDRTPTSFATVVAEGTGTATLTASITPVGPFTTGASETSGSTTVTVQ